MSHKHPPNPARFDVYSELPDRSGFTIKGTEFVFKFDKYGGWFDQFGNYYVCDGVPGDAPSDSESYHSQNQHSHNSHDDEQDQFQKQFGGPNKHYSDEQDETEDIHFSKIAANLVTLNSYPSGKPFRINFRNLPYISKRNEAFEYFRGKVPGILNVIFLQNEKKQFNGNGYFVLEDGKSGESLIRLEGEKYNGREISFSLDSAEDFILDPINDDELYPDFTNKKALKSYITKGKPAQKQEPKKQQFPQLAKVEAKVEVKPQPKQQSPAKVQKKIENEQEFASYIFERKVFPKKSSFNQWIENNKFSHQNDIKQVSKIQGDQNRAKVTMKRKVFNALNGKVQKGVKVVFQPTQK